MRAPCYRLHKRSGQAIVTVKGKMFYLGPYGSPESYAEYEKLIGQYLHTTTRKPWRGPIANGVHAMSEPEHLTPAENGRLAVLEARIRCGLNQFLEVGAALLEIRDQRLYREQYHSFESYLEQHWNISRSHAYRIMDAAEIAKDVSLPDMATRTYTLTLEVPSSEADPAGNVLPGRDAGRKRQVFSIDRGRDLAIGGL